MRVPRTSFAIFNSILALTFTLALVHAHAAYAADIYVAQSALGSGNGIDCADAKAASWFNSSSSWGTNAGQIGPGTTVHLCGTFTDRTPGDTLLNVLGSGTSSSPITIKFESGATLTNTAYWGLNGAIYLNGNSWVTVDGGGTGIIQNTGNGTGLAYAQPSTAIFLGNTQNVTIKNLVISNICQHTSISDSNACNSGGANDKAVKIQNGAIKLLIQGNTIHDSQNCIELYGSNSDTVTINGNTIYRCNWGIGGYGASTSVVITNNDIYGVIGGPNNWATTNDQFHHNGIFFFPQSANMNGMVIADNFIHDIGGTTGSSGTETGHIYIEPGSGADVPNALIYNNVLTTSAGAYPPANAYITDREGASGTKIFNNTIVESSGAATHWNSCIMAQNSPTIENNVCEGMQVGIWLSNNPTSVVSNYNDFYGLLGNGTGAFITGDGATGYPTLSAWTSSTGYDASSIATDPSLTSAFMLNSGSPVIGKGTNLTSTGISGLTASAPQIFGINYSCGTACLTRPSSGAWDMGAYEFSGSGSTQKPAAPTGLTGQPTQIP